MINYKDPVTSFDTIIYHKITKSVLGVNMILGFTYTFMWIDSDKPSHLGQRCTSRHVYFHFKLMVEYTELLKPQNSTEDKRRWLMIIERDVHVDDDGAQNFNSMVGQYIT